MTLPEIPLPLEVPFEIPMMIHPIVAHFAIALPVVILFIELINLYYKRRALSVTSLLVMLLLGTIYVALFLTGKVDGKEAYMLLSDAGQHELKEHKLLGMYLVYATVLLILLKSLAMMIQKTGMKIAFFIAILGFIALTFVQGKHGGELVYEYGANVQAAVEAQDALEELQDEMDTLQEKVQTLEEEAAKGLDEKAVEMVGKAVNAVKEVIESADMNSSNSSDINNTTTEGNTTV